MVSRDPDVGPIRRNPSENLRFHFFILLSLERLLAREEGEGGAKGGKKKKESINTFFYDANKDIITEYNSWYKSVNIRFPL